MGKRPHNKSQGPKRGRSGPPSGRSRLDSDGPSAKNVDYHKGEQVEGRQAVRELLLAGTRKVKEIYISDSADGAEILEDIAMLAKQMRVLVKEVSYKRLTSEAKTGSHQGVVARAEPLEFASMTELVANPQAFIIVLDRVTDPGNFGSILRIAECAGVTGVVIAERRSVTITPTVAKTAAGALEHVKICRVGGIPTAVSELNEAGVSTIGLDAAGKDALFSPKTHVQRPIAIVMGAEGAGLSQLVRTRVNRLVSIPLLGELNSLNVATATAVACFEVVRRTENYGD